MPFSDIHISQGSVATHLTCGGIFKHEFPGNLILSPSVKKKFGNRLIIGEVMGKSLVSCFLTHSVVAGDDLPFGYTQISLLHHVG